MSDPPAVMSPDRINPVNLITATRLPRVPVQRFGFLLGNSPEWLARFFDEQALAVQFKTFNFLHTARWVALGGFPRVARDQARERLLNPRWVIFIANFDGGWEPYFGTFMEAMGEGVYDLWGQSVGYPDFPAPGTANALRKWLATRLPLSQHWYAAYPWATANDVRSAVRVRREVSSVVIDLQRRRIGRSKDVSGPFDNLARRLRECLGPIESERWSPPTNLPDILPNGRVYGYVGVFPVLPDDDDEIERAIIKLLPGPGSPFRRVPGTHFARLALLRRDQIGKHPEDATVTLRNSYLLFAADFDSPKPTERSACEQFVKSVYDAMPDVVCAIWGHCQGFDCADAERTFTALAMRCQRPVLLEFIDCAYQSLGSVLAALNSHGPFVDLVQRRSRGGKIRLGELTDVLDHPPGHLPRTV